MKKTLFASLAVLALAGCSSFTDIGHPKDPIFTDDGEPVVASVTVFNISYSLFGILPICSGTTWKEGPYKDRDLWNVTWFEDRCTLDENIASVKAALRETGSNRIENLVTDSDNWRFWSLFIINRKVMKSNCAILKPLSAPTAR